MQQVVPLLIKINEVNMVAGVALVVAGIMGVRIHREATLRQAEVLVEAQPTAGGTQQAADMHRTIVSVLTRVYLLDVACLLCCR